jgi:glutamine amidotransferase
MITIVDYGVGNIMAFANTYKRLDIPHVVATSAEQLRDATRIILPGVGSFDHAMQRLESSGMRQVLDDLVLNKKVPVLGICVGMQMLAESSEEGTEAGLGWIKGKVRKFDVTKFTQTTHLPHMGWNNVRPNPDQALFKDLDNNSLFYFLHSYYFECHQEENVLAQSQYGFNFSCAVGTNNVFGVQFHPEKSHHFGATLLKNFAEI